MNWRLNAMAASVVLVSALCGPMHAAGRDAPAIQVASLFGESDDEKAARLQHESDQDAQLRDLKQRVQDLEQSLQQVTGQNEQLSHRIQELADRIDRQQKDFDYKLCALAAQQLGAGTAADQSGGGLPCDTGAAMSTLATPSSPTLGSGGTLGTLPQGAANQPSARSQFADAMNMLAKAQYDAARAAFRSFADANPQDELAPQALYWVGDIAFVQKDYAGAAQAFAEEIKKYPTNPRSAESMLKLGQSLLALGQKKEGCLTLGAIKSKYPKASSQVLSQAASARAAACTKRN
ncbi:MAG: tol-pal system protein YbgF [Alphaproteobacteria bacterium]|nr:tol-pal system protein YbgF [Alphaproteobacteria bacterium]